MIAISLCALGGSAVRTAHLGLLELRVCGRAEGQNKSARELKAPCVHPVSFFRVSACRHRLVELPLRPQISTQQFKSSLAEATWYLLTPCSLQRLRVCVQTHVRSHGFCPESLMGPRDQLRPSMFELTSVRVFVAPSVCRGDRNCVVSVTHIRWSHIVRRGRCR